MVKPTTTNNGEVLTQNVDTVGEFFSTLLHAATSAHILHLKERSFAAHMALNDLYQGLPGLADGLIEAYQGKTGTLVDDYPSGYEPPQEDSEEFVKNFRDYFENNRSILGDATELQNMADGITELLDSTLYKLRFLS